MAVIQSSLSTWVPTAQEVLAKMKLEDDQEDEEEEEEKHVVKKESRTSQSGTRMQRQRRRTEDNAVARVRKALKMIHSAIDSSTTTKTTSHGIFSSKAD